MNQSSHSIFCEIDIQLASIENILAIIKDFLLEHLIQRPVLLLFCNEKEKKYIFKQYLPRKT